MKRIVLWSAGIAAAAGIVAAGYLLFSLWRSIHLGALLSPEALAGPDTVALFSFTARPDDAGVTAALARIGEMDARRRDSRLPVWARWLISGGTPEAPSTTAEVLMPLRLVTSLDHTKGGTSYGALVVSLSRFSDRIAGALGADPARRYKGIPVAAPARPGDPFTALVGNNVAVCAEEKDLDETIDRILFRSRRPGSVFAAALASVPAGGDGIAVVLNTNDCLETMARDELRRYGIEIGSIGGSSRLVPQELLGSGFSLDLVSADEARIEGKVLFAGGSSAEEGIHWVRRGLPQALALFGLESEFQVSREGETLRVSGTLRGLDAVWDRLIAGRLMRTGHETPR